MQMEDVDMISPQGHKTFSMLNSAEHANKQQINFFLISA